MKTLMMLTALAVTACALPAPKRSAAGGDDEGGTGSSGNPVSASIQQVASKESGMTGGEVERQLVLGGGCFWCLEAVFELVPGVLSVESGYAGGSRENPSYEQVSTGLTGHAEVVRISYDPARVALADLFDLFFQTHDPTTEDRQGADIGPQYRSIILFEGDEQRREAEAALRRWAPEFKRPIVTELQALDHFWPAEDYHQDFFRLNPNYGYCRVVIAPKVDKALDLIKP